MASDRDIPLVTVAFSGVLPGTGPDARVLGDTATSLARPKGLGDPAWSEVYGQLYLHPFPAVVRSDVPTPPTMQSASFQREGPSAERSAGLGARLSVPDGRCVYVRAGTERPATTFPWCELFAAFRGPRRRRRGDHRPARRPGEPSVPFRPMCASSASCRKQSCCAE